MDCAECVQHMKFARPGAATAPMLPISMLKYLPVLSRRVYALVTSSEMREYLLAQGYAEAELADKDKRDLWDLVTGGER